MKIFDHTKSFLYNSGGERIGEVIDKEECSDIFCADRLLCNCKILVVKYRDGEKNNRCFYMSRYIRDEIE